MLLDLSRVRTPHERYEKVFDPEMFWDDQSQFRVLHPVSLAFDIFKNQSQFRLAGSVDTVLELPCSRCVEAFTIPVHADFDLRYQPHTLNTGEGEKEIEEDDLTTAFYEHDQIDLGQLMREQLYLALPMKPLCFEECLGLCPVCGANRNRESCSCTQAWEDPRFAALRELRSKN
jgi:DUF177 domain-containing protein